MATIPKDTQYLRKASLLVLSGTQTIDLSNLHFRFQTFQDDEESPANCVIRVHNLKAETEQALRKEFNEVVVQAGYENAAYGVIFSGTIKQFRTGRESNGVDTYLDILAADGDVGYNYGINNTTLASGMTGRQRLEATIKELNVVGLSQGELQIDGVGGVLPRGKVLFGLARGHLRAQSQNFGATWSIQNGKIQVLPLDGYLPGEAVVLTAQTGLIGRPEQTAEGIKVRCLLNPKITIGATVKIDNASINTTHQALNNEGKLVFNKYAGLQMLADISADGLYRVYVSEFVGDTRGQEWYTDLICLSIDPVTQKVKKYG